MKSEARKKIEEAVKRELELEAQRESLHYAGDLGRFAGASSLDTVAGPRRGKPRTLAEAIDAVKEALTRAADQIGAAPERVYVQKEAGGPNLAFYVKRKPTEEELREKYETEVTRRMAEYRAARDEAKRAAKELERLGREKAEEAERLQRRAEEAAERARKLEEEGAL